MRARSVTFFMLACNGKGWWTFNLYKCSIFVILQTQVSTQPKFKLRNETSACGCNIKSIIRSFRTRYFHVSYHRHIYVAWQRRSRGDAAKVTRWRHWWIHHFLCLKFRFCITTVSNIMITWCSGIARDWCASLIMTVHICRGNFVNSAWLADCHCVGLCYIILCNICSMLYKCSIHS